MLVLYYVDRSRRVPDVGCGIAKKQKNGEKMKRLVMSFVAVALFPLMVSTAVAGTSVAWTSPPNGSSFPAGTAVSPTGQASAFGTIGGTGLDLALVLDSSGSMQLNAGTSQSLQQWQKDAAIALVNALPVGSTAVTVIEFDSSASTVRVLSELSTDKVQIIAAINSVDASGGTTIGSGIDQAASELTGANPHISYAVRRSAVGHVCRGL